MLAVRVERDHAHAAGPRVRNMVQARAQGHAFSKIGTVAQEHGPVFLGLAEKRLEGLAASVVHHHNPRERPGGQQLPYDLYQAGFRLVGRNQRDRKQRVSLLVHWNIHPRAETLYRFKKTG